MKTPDLLELAARVAATNPPGIRPGATVHSHATAPENRAESGVDTMLSAFSVVPHTQSLRIVGSISDDPDTLRGIGRARAFIPLDFAQGLQIMLPSDLREESGLGRAYTQLNVRVRNSRDVPALKMPFIEWNLPLFP